MVTTIKINCMRGKFHRNWESRQLLIFGWKLIIALGNGKISRSGWMLRGSLKIASTWKYDFPECTRQRIRRAFALIHCWHNVYAPFINHVGHSSATTFVWLVDRLHVHPSACSQPAETSDAQHQFNWNNLKNNSSKRQLPPDWLDLTWNTKKNKGRFHSLTSIHPMLVLIPLDLLHTQCNADMGSHAGSIMQTEDKHIITHSTPNRVILCRWWQSLCQSTSTTSAPNDFDLLHFIWKLRKMEHCHRMTFANICPHRNGNFCNLNISRTSSHLQWVHWMMNAIRAGYCSEFNQLEKLNCFRNGIMSRP